MKLIHFEAVSNHDLRIDREATVAAVHARAADAAKAAKRTLVLPPETSINATYQGADGRMLSAFTRDETVFRFELD